MTRNYCGFKVSQYSLISSVPGRIGLSFRRLAVANSVKRKSVLFNANSLTIVSSSKKNKDKYQTQ
jgi:hypothetical protein